MFLSNCFEWLSLAWEFASVSSAWVTVIFSTSIAQGSVVTRLKCGGIFNYCFARHLLLSLSLKEF